MDGQLESVPRESEGQLHFCAVWPRRPNQGTSSFELKEEAQLAMCVRVVSLKWPVPHACA
jgi:hypothetical protein